MPVAISTDDEGVARSDMTHGNICGQCSLSLALCGFETHDAAEHRAQLCAGAKFVGRDQGIIPPRCRLRK